MGWHDHRLQRGSLGIKAIEHQRRWRGCGWDVASIKVARFHDAGHEQGLALSSPRFGLVILGQQLIESGCLTDLVDGCLIVSWESICGSVNVPGTIVLGALGRGQRKGHYQTIIGYNYGTRLYVQMSAPAVTKTKANKTIFMVMLFHHGRPLVASAFCLKLTAASLVSPANTN